MTVVVVNPFILASWNPSQIQTALWLDASDTRTMYNQSAGGSFSTNNGVVARLEDKSGNSRHAIESTNPPTRIDGILNGFSGVRFNGSTNRLIVTSSFLAGVTLKSLSFVYARRSNNAAYMPTVASYSSSNSDIGSYHFIKNDSRQASYPHYPTTTWGSADPAGAQTTAIAAFDIVQFRANTNQWQININGSSIYQSATGTLSASFTEDGLGLAYQTGVNRYSNLDICELIVCVGSVATANNQIIEGYFAWKYNLVQNLPSNHPYKNVSPTS